MKRAIPLFIMLFLAALCILLAATGGRSAETTYTINRPLSQIVDSIRIGDLAPDSRLVSDMMPALRALPAVLVEMRAIPTGAQRRYDFVIRLAEPLLTTQDGRKVWILGLTKTLTLTPDDATGTTRVCSGVTVRPQLPRTRCGLVNRLIDRVANKLTLQAEWAILARERQILLSLGEN